MRKPRVVIIDDEVFILNMLKSFFVMRGYEVLSYADPGAVCPLLGLEGDRCRYQRPCADVMITDFLMPGMNGVELLDHQQRHGCRIDVRNKAVISGYIDERSRAKVREMGCAFFQKPFTLIALSDWLAECEQRMELDAPLASRRREERFDSHREVTVRMTRSDQVLTGVAVNVSGSGLCLKVEEPLRLDEMVRIDAGHFADCRKASVRWVRRVGSASYLAGLHCC